MPSHPDRVRRAYTTPLPEPTWRGGVDMATGDYVVTIRLPRAVADQPKTDAEGRELLRRLRHRVAEALAR